jgi:biotin carboxyl carrier protein
LATISGIVVAVVVWSIVATIPQQISVPAVISVDALRTLVVSPVSGQVDVLVTQGTSVKQGEKVATVEPFGEGPTVDVTAPADGMVGSIEVADGQGVEPGTAVTSVSRSPDAEAGTVVVTFLPSSQALLFKSGADVKVIVTDLETSQQVAIEAKVQSIAISPSDSEAITTETGSPAFAAELTSQGSGVLYRVSMTLTAAPETLPSINVTPGEIVQIVNTYAQPHPIDLLFGGR